MSELVELKESLFRSSNLFLYLKIPIDKWLAENPPPHFARCTVDDIYIALFGEEDLNDTIRYAIQFIYCEKIKLLIEMEIIKWQDKYSLFLEDLISHVTNKD